MKRITVKELIKFNRRLTDKSKRNYAAKLKSREEKEKVDSVEKEEARDYWVTSTSSIQNTFKYAKDAYYDAKIEDLQSRLEAKEDKRIVSMYQRNIDILNNFKSYDIRKYRPSSDLRFESVPKSYKILTLKTIPLFVNPNLLYSFKNGEERQLGAIWLVPQLNGFNKIELGMFCELLHKFLKKNYSDEYNISSKYCVVVDTYKAQVITHKQLIDEGIPLILSEILKEFKKI